jgi:hypothetical protein
MPVDAPVMTTDLMLLQALVRGLMKFVVKESLSGRIQARLDGLLSDSFPFEVSPERFEEDSSRTGLPEAAVNACCVQRGRFLA